MMAKNQDNETQDETELMQDVTIDADSGEVEQGKQPDEDCGCNEELEPLMSEEVVVDLSEAVEMAFGGEEGLSEEVKTKVQTVLEAAVKVKVKEELAKINEEAQDAFQVRMSEMEAEVDTKIDTYLQEHVIPKWMEENKVALETGIKNKIAENFIADLKELLESYNINITQDEADALDEAAEVISGLKTELNETVDALAEAKAEIVALKKARVVEGLAEGLTVTQVEKFNKLVEEITASDLEVFENKAKILRDSLFEKVDNKDATKVVTEKVVDTSSDPVMARILQHVKKQNLKD
jgi:hypothetical protein